MRIPNGRPLPAIPNDHLARAVFAFWNPSFELRVLNRMILDFDRQPFIRRIERRSFRNCPTLEHAVQFQPKVIVQSRRRMLLNDEAQLPLQLGLSYFARRLSRLIEMSLFPVFREW